MVFFNFDIMARQWPPRWIMVGMAVAASGLLLQCIGLTTNRWITMGQDPLWPRHINETGLWNWCRNCTKPAWLYTCRVLGISGASTLGLSLAPAALLRWKGHTCWNSLPGVLALSAALFIMLEFSIYADNVKVAVMGFEYWYRSSFALTVLAFLFALAAGILYLLPVFSVD